jgi:hypothetical protein
MVTVLPPEEVSTAVKLSANVLKALPSPDPFVMSLAAKVYGQSLSCVRQDRLQAVK